MGLCPIPARRRSPAAKCANPAFAASWSIARTIVAATRLRSAMMHGRMMSASRRVSSAGHAASAVRCVSGRGSIVALAEAPQSFGEISFLESYRAHQRISGLPRVISLPRRIAAPVTSRSSSLIAASQGTTILCCSFDQAMNFPFRSDARQLLARKAKPNPEPLQRTTRQPSTVSQACKN